MARIISERSIYVFLAMALAFMWLTFNRDIAQIYIIFLMADYFVFDQYSSRIRYRLNAVPGNTLKSIFLASIATAVFLAFSYFTAIIFQAAAPIIQGEFISSYLKIFAEITPVLAGNKILTLIGWGLIVPIIETRLFFGRLLDLLSLATGSPLTDLKNKKTWIIMFVIAVAFAYFHLSVRGLSNNIGLLGTFIFAIISMALVIRTKEIESAIWFHVIWNSWVTYQNLF